jgi:hypothetical protein
VQKFKRLQDKQAWVSRRAAKHARVDARRHYLQHLERTPPTAVVVRTFQVW